MECPSNKHISLIVTVVSLISQLMTVIVDEANQCFNMSFIYAFYVIKLTPAIAFFNQRQNKFFANSFGTDEDQTRFGTHLTKTISAGIFFCWWKSVRVSDPAISVCASKPPAPCSTHQLRCWISAHLALAIRLVGDVIRESSTRHRILL